MIEVRRIDLTDLEKVVPLFDAYRMFYESKSDISGARQFLSDRLINNESCIFGAFTNNECVGFTQLYPLFTSVGMKPIWLLNDLFVTEQFRKKGVAEALIERVKLYAKQTNRKKIILSTAYSNINAQKLYERLGFIRGEYHEYAFNLDLLD